MYNFCFICTFYYLFLKIPVIINIYVKKTFVKRESCRKIRFSTFRRGSLLIFFRRGAFLKDDESLNYACMPHYTALLLSHRFRMLLLENNYRVQRLES